MKSFFFGAWCCLLAGVLAPRAYAQPTVLVDAVVVGGQDHPRLRSVAVTVYLRNDTDHSLMIPVGSAVGVGLSSTGVSFSARAAVLHSGEVVKPTPATLDVVELKPGEVVRLRTVEIQRPLEENGPIRVFYKVDSSLLQFYQVWIGETQGRYPDDPWEGPLTSKAKAA